MDETLNIIRELTSQLEDPPEIPYEVIMRDSEMLSEQESERTVSEMFDPPTEPLTRRVENLRVPQMNLRVMQDIDAASVGQSQKSHEAGAEVNRNEPFGFPVAPVEVRRTQSGEDVQIYEPMRVASAAATANLRERIEEEPSPVNRRSVEDYQQVTPETRVSHFAPEGFPINLPDALSLVDQHINLPSREIDTDPPVLPDYPSIGALQSSEQITVDMSYAEDSDERYVL